ncbi:hypothetical protein [Weissella tructae]
MSDKGYRQLENQLIRNADKDKKYSKVYAAKGVKTQPRKPTTQVERY